MRLDQVKKGARIRFPGNEWAGTGEITKVDGRSFTVRWDMSGENGGIPLDVEYDDMCSPAPFILVEEPRPTPADRMVNGVPRCVDCGVMSSARRCWPCSAKAMPNALELSENDLTNHEASRVNHCLQAIAEENAKLRENARIVIEQSKRHEEENGRLRAELAALAGKASSFTPADAIALAQQLSRAQAEIAGFEARCEQLERHNARLREESRQRG